MLNIFRNIQYLPKFREMLIRIAAKFNEKLFENSDFKFGRILINNMKTFYKMLLGFSVSNGAKV